MCVCTGKPGNATIVNAINATLVYHAVIYEFMILFPIKFFPNPGQKIFSKLANLILHFLSWNECIDELIFQIRVNFGIIRIKFTGYWHISINLATFISWKHTK